METENPNKQRILEVALSLFAAKGYEAAGIQEIVTTAGISKPTLYYYFGSKLGILNEIIKTCGEPVLSAITNAATYNHDLIMHLTAVLKAEIATAQRAPDFFRLYTAASFAGAESELCKAFEPFRCHIADCFRTLFLLSTEEFGNMRGWEDLYSKTFRFLAESTALAVLNNELTVDDGSVFKIVHSFMYGVVN